MTIRQLNGRLIDYCIWLFPFIWLKTLFDLRLFDLRLFDFRLFDLGLFYFRLIDFRLFDYKTIRLIDYQSDYSTFRLSIWIFDN